MSGIAAIFNRDGRPAESRMIKAMLDAIHHRGPDREGVWIEGAVALGQRMLHATPEAVAEQQPWSDEGRRYRLVFDGRIDNGVDLQLQLSAAGVETRINTDAELILRSYQCWGEEFAAKLTGDFAVLIWDSQSQTLIGVRDRSGVKPFYYYQDGKRFACGSELHQLFHCGAPCQPNEGTIGEYLADQPCTADQTLYRSIQQLLPAHLLIVRRKGLVTRPYYDLTPTAIIRHSNDDEYANHFLSIFKEAVYCRMRAVGPVAADLSGGIDSSSIVSIAQILQDQETARCDGFESFSEVFPGLSCDESEYIKAVAARSRVALNFRPPTPANEIDLAAQVRQFRDFPTYPNFASGLDFRRLQRRKGARVSLTGEGGDEWFSGSMEDNADLLCSLRILSLIRQIRIDSHQSSTRLMHHFSPGHLLIKTAVVPLLPRVVRQFVRRRARARVPYVEWINPDFARRIDLYARLIAEPPLSHVKGIGRQSIYDAFHNGSISIVLGMIDHADARLGLDARHPFFDQRLIEFAFALPNDQLRRDGFERYIVRNAMRGILPEIVRTRVTKGSFNQPILASVEHNSAFIRFDRLEIAERGWVNAAKLKSAFEALMASYRNGDGNYGFPVWMAIATEIWHRVVFGSGKFER